MPGHTTKIRTGVAIQLPPGHVGLFRDRSSLGVKGITIFGGVLDEDYTGEMHIILYNSTRQVHNIAVGDKIGQMLVMPVFQEEVEVVDSLAVTDRGSQGFGSSGK